MRAVGFQLFGAVDVLGAGLLTPPSRRPKVSCGAVRPAVGRVARSETGHNCYAASLCATTGRSQTRSLGAPLTLVS
jgi:hypothetical protein